MNKRKFQGIAEEEVRRQESRLPQFAMAAGASAYRDSLQRFGRVVTAQGNQVVELHQDGTVTVIGSLPPATKVPVRASGRKVQLVAPRKKP